MDLGAAAPGKALPVVGRCVLCCRRSVTRIFQDRMRAGTAGGVGNEAFNPYCNKEGEYADHLAVDRLNPHLYRGVTGPFVEYDAGHYRLEGRTSVVHTSAVDRNRPLNWMTHIICSRRIGPWRGTGRGPRDGPWWCAHTHRVS